MFVLLAMSANYLLMRACFPEPSFVEIPYTLFKEQVAAGNVVGVTSLGDSIQGVFKVEVTSLHPLGPRVLPAGTASSSSRAQAGVLRREETEELSRR